MTIKYIELGDNWDLEDFLNFGLGSIYLAGPRNNLGKSWRSDFCNKIERLGVDVSIVSPEPRNYFETFEETITPDMYLWRKKAIACATTIVFWWPKNTIDIISGIEFGSWYKEERVFVGCEELNNNSSYIDWLYHKEHLMHPAHSINELVENVVKWLLG
jgi:hypothetical protein